MSAANYSEAVKELDIPNQRDEAGSNIVPASAVFPVDPNQNPIVNRMPVAVVSGNLGAATPAFIAYPVRSQTLNNGTPALATFAAMYLWNEGLALTEILRTPATFNHALCTTVAATAIWTPAAGKKFRLMGYVICPDAGLAAAGIQLITFLDQAAAITIAHQTYLPIAASITHQVPIVVNLPGNGYLSSAANNVLNVTLTSACTAGAISVFVYGTEE